MLTHLPINHPLRGLYRFLGALAGLYVLLFGIVGIAQSNGTTLFSREHIVALGLRTNLAFSILSVVAGVVMVAAALIGRNVSFYLFLFGGLVFLVAGFAMLVVLQTSLNILNFTVATCVVSFVIGLVLLTAGLYGRAGKPVEQESGDQPTHPGTTAVPA